MTDETIALPSYSKHASPLVTHVLRRELLDMEKTRMSLLRHGIFANELNPLSSIHAAAAFSQGQQDQYFYAALAAMAWLRPDCILDMICINGCGDAAIRFPGYIKDPVLLSVKELAELKELDCPDGCWPLLLGKAKEKLISKIQTSPGSISRPDLIAERKLPLEWQREYLHTAKQVEALEVLCGNKILCKRIQDEDCNSYSSMLIEQVQSKKKVVILSSKCADGFTFHGLKFGAVFPIIGIEETAGEPLLTLLELSEPEMTVKTRVRQISLLDIKQNFQNIYIETDKPISRASAD